MLTQQNVHVLRYPQKTLDIGSDYGGGEFLDQLA
jgi:hypothetical protein